MSKSVIIQDLTSQLNQMNFICTYHPKFDLYSDMFFDCQDSDEEPSKINLILAVSIDEKQKKLKYYHQICEYNVNEKKNKVQLSDPIEGFQQFVSYQTVTGKTKHIYLDPEEIVDFLKKYSEKYDYTFVRIGNNETVEGNDTPKVKRSTKESVPVLTIVTLLLLSAVSMFFQLTPRDWIVSLVLAIIFILSTQMIPKQKWPLTSLWILMQTIIWLIY